MKSDFYKINMFNFLVKTMLLRFQNKQILKIFIFTWKCNEISIINVIVISNLIL